MTYTERQISRLNQGNCPHCGHEPREHTAAGGPPGCRWTYREVNDAIVDYRREARP